MLAQAQGNFAVKQFQRNQLRKLHAFVQKLSLPDQEQQKRRAAEETAQQSQQLEEAHKETILLFSDVYDGVNELH